MELTSPAFDDGEEIPREYGYTERNANPPLDIRDVPEEAETLALIVDDPDALEPAGKIWVHWLVWDMPASTSAIEDHESITQGVEGQNDFGTIGYGGPNPPDGEHEYVFRLYAIDTELGLSEGADRDRLETAMQGHVVAETELRGTYAP